MTDPVHIHPRDLAFDWVPYGTSVDVAPLECGRYDCAATKQRGIMHERCTNPATGMRRQHPTHPDPIAGAWPVCGIHAAPRNISLLARDVVVDR